MKRDFRRSEIPNLNENFRDYSSGTSLLAHYNFGQLYYNITGSVPNTAKDSTYSPLSYSSAILPIAQAVDGGPYVGKTDLKSFSVLLFFSLLSKKCLITLDLCNISLSNFIFVLKFLSKFCSTTSI